MDEDIVDVLVDVLVVSFQDAQNRLNEVSCLPNIQRPIPIDIVLLPNLINRLPQNLQIDFFLLAPPAPVSITIIHPSIRRRLLPQLIIHILQQLILRRLAQIVFNCEVLHDILRLVVLINPKVLESASVLILKLKLHDADWVRISAPEVRILRQRVVAGLDEFVPVE